MVLGVVLACGACVQSEKDVNGRSVRGRKALLALWLAKNLLEVPSVPLRSFSSNKNPSLFSSDTAGRQAPPKRQSVQNVF